MNPVLLWIAAGYLFWLGLFLQAGAAVCWGCGRYRWGQGLWLPGGVCVLFAAVPFHWVIWCGLVLGGVGLWLPRARRTRWRFGLLTGYAVCLLLAAGVEVRYWRLPAPVPYSGKVYVVGDSISAGVGFRGEVTYAELLGTDWSNHSVGGGTVGSALRTMELVKAGPGDVILFEIGGNDLLGGTSGSDFRRGLAALLRRGRETGARLAMLELPLPPLTQAYGRAQRELAAQYEVALIPRRGFARVLSGAGSTVDGLHLANFGHRKMAALLRPQFQAVAKQGNGSAGPLKTRHQESGE